MLIVIDGKTRPFRNSAAVGYQISQVRLFVRYVLVTTGFQRVQEIIQATIADKPKLWKLTRRTHRAKASVSVSIASRYPHHVAVWFLGGLGFDIRGQFKASSSIS